MTFTRTRKNANLSQAISVNDNLIINTLFISDGGYVGINTGSGYPTTALDVSGVITATGGNSTNWNTAYGWGNHASAGYQSASTALTTSTSFGGDVSGTYNNIVIVDDSHNHIIGNVDGLQTALDGKLNTTLKGANNGLAELDSGGKVPSSQLPSYVDDVLEYANLAGFPGTGETGKIYVAIDTNLTYRWSGSAYVEISASLALGETSSTAYRGDRGKEAYDHSQLTTGSVHGSTTVGGNLLRLTNPSAIRFLRVNADNTVSALSDSDFRTAIGAGTSSTNGTVTSVGGTGTVAGLTLSGTVTSTGNLTLGGSLSSATSSANGGIKLGSDTVQSVAANSVTATSSRTYAVQLNATGQAVVNVPWVDTDTNTTYTAGTGLTLTGTSFSVNYGATSITACVGNDSRLSDARTPTAHALSSHTATSWRMFYSNATTTAIQELAFGNAGTYLRSAGASANPTWSTVQYSELGGTIPTWNQNTTGSAATLTTARTLTIGSTGKTFNGSADVSWSLGEIGAAATNQTMYIGTTAVAINRGTGALSLTGVSIDGNAGTVTNGVYTTGSYADPSWITSINYNKLTGTIPTWNQNTTGSAATLTTSRTLWGQSFNGSANVTGNMSNVGKIEQSWGDQRVGIFFNNDFRNGMAVFGNSRLTTIFSTTNDATGGAITFNTRAGSGASDTDYGTERMRIDNAGNVGIGTTSPTTLLDVSGVITASGGNSTNWNTAYGWGNHATQGYLTANQTITLSGDVSGSGTTSINVTIADDSHNHIIGNVDGLQTALDGKVAKSGDTMTGALTLSGDPSSSLHAATKQYVDNILATNNAMIFKGSIGTGGIASLPTSFEAGWAYVVTTQGTYANQVCEQGDLIIATIDRASGGTDADWIVVQTNIDGAVIGPASATSGNFPVFNGTTGKLIANSTYGPSSFAAASHNQAISTISDSTTVGQNLVKLTNPSAIRFLRVNADNTVTALSDSDFRTAIGAGTSSTTGTVTSVAALTLGTTGTDVSSTVANGTTTPVITLNIPTASASNRGALSSTDWTTFNNKQAAITGGATTITSSNLTVSRALVSDGSGKVAVSSVTSTELGYVSGVTSSIQTQLNGKQATLTNPVTGTGTTNYISKWTSSSAQGNSLIYDNGTYVGIGTTSPAAQLHVAGNVLCDQSYMEKTSAPAISSGSLTLNLNNGSIFLVSLNAAITSITISNVPSTSNTSVAFSIVFTADGTARSVTWPASVKWSGGTAPTLTSTDTKKDILSFVSTDQGSTWFGFVGGQNY